MRHGNGPSRVEAMKKGCRVEHFVVAEAKAHCSRGLVAKLVNKLGVGGRMQRVYAFKILVWNGEQMDASSGIVIHKSDA